MKTKRVNCFLKHSVVVTKQYIFLKMYLQDGSNSYGTGGGEFEGIGSWKL